VIEGDSSVKQVKPANEGRWERDE